MLVSRVRTPKSNVCLVQPHPLAVKDFSRKLGARSRVFVVPDCQAFPKHAISNTPELVFIFDKATVTVPMGLCLETLRRFCPEPKAILLTQASEPEEQFQLLSIGLKGVILYKDVVDQLRQAVLSVISGGYWVTADVLGQYVLRRLGKHGVRNSDVLTHRESEVFQLLKHRFSNKEIGLKLVLSEGTVKFHVANIFSKLGVHDRQSVCDLLDIDHHGHLNPSAPKNSSTATLPPSQFRSLRAS
jgi:DNA-binding NarL/FixJ family response regulator